ncbi:hypothetical protein [Streptomyces mirabilis]|uniref:hypothetical protein n=1 Tax=Streptomyces mirabilis TaxID=68239 RepID=UPI0038255675
MANGVYHTGYGIEINLSRSDLGNPGRDGLMEEILQPVGGRSRTMLQCLADRKGDACQCALEDKTPWMFVRRQRREHGIVLVAAHLPLTHVATPAEIARREAMKERIARTAAQHGLGVDTDARSRDGRLLAQVLVSGAASRVGWKAQYAPVSESAVYRHTAQAREGGVTPVWVTADAASAVIDRAPWARVDDVPWQHIASRLRMLIRGGVRHLQLWKCTPASERPCPVTGQSCGKWHYGWFLPALCLPPEQATSLDEFIITSAEGEHRALRVPDPDRPRRSSHLWALARDVKAWEDLNGPASRQSGSDNEPEDEPLTFTEDKLDPTCRYGDEQPHTSGRRPQRGISAVTGLRTLDTTPAITRHSPSRPVHLRLTERERTVIAAELGCPPWEIGPCQLCATPIHRYGHRGYLACTNCRTSPML